MFHSEPHLNMAILYDNIDSLKNYLIVDVNFEYIMIPLFFILQLWKQGGVLCLKFFLKVLNTTQCVVFHFYSTRGKKKEIWLSSWGQEFSNAKCHIYIMTRGSCLVIPGPHYSKERPNWGNRASCGCCPCPEDFICMPTLHIGSAVSEKTGT